MIAGQTMQLNWEKKLFVYSNLDYKNYTLLVLLHEQKNRKGVRCAKMEDYGHAKFYKKIQRVQNYANRYL